MALPASAALSPRAPALIFLPCVVVSGLFRTFSQVVALGEAEVVPGQASEENGAGGKYEENNLRQAAMYQEGGQGKRPREREAEQTPETQH